MSDQLPEDARRLGDAIAIPGDYQHRALTEGPPVQRHWHRAKLELLDWFCPPLPGGRALDVGCGSGVIADALATRGMEVLAVDANPEAVRYARTTFGRPGLELREGYLDELELPAASFDLATCLEIIEHVHLPQIEKLLGDLFALIRPGGRLLLTTPNYRGLWPLVEWAADRFASTANMDADQHVTHLHRRQLRRLIEGAGFELERIRCYCTLAPFVAPISARLARAVDGLERRIDLPFGNLLALVARRPEPVR
ncbi:MAG: methyltransferase domain-containing protein [Planctomycetes bacterium]|nr:methyltransferase domain-containing protein [Planctomycetota bacterium]